MAELKSWNYETEIEIDLGDGETVKRDISVPVWPSEHPEYNWETVYGRNRLRFKTKKSARKNLDRIV